MYDPNQEALFEMPKPQEYRQLNIYDDLPQPTDFQIYSPLDDPNKIHSEGEDRELFRKHLTTPRERASHILNISDEVSYLRGLRDTRLIYDIEIDTMAQVMGVEPEEYSIWELPEYCQNPDIQQEGHIQRSFDMRKLVTVLEQFGFRRDEVAPVIKNDAAFTSEMLLEGRIMQLVSAAMPLKPVAHARYNRPTIEREEFDHDLIARLIGRSEQRRGAWGWVGRKVVGDTFFTKDISDDQGSGVNQSAASQNARQLERLGLIERLGHRIHNPYVKLDSPHWQELTDLLTEYKA